MVLSRSVGFSLKEEVETVGLVYVMSRKGARRRRSTGTGIPRAHTDYPETVSPQHKVDVEEIKIETEFVVDCNCHMLRGSARASGVFQAKLCVYKLASWCLRTITVQGPGRGVATQKWVTEKEGTLPTQPTAWVSAVRRLTTSLTLLAVPSRPSSGQSQSGESLFSV